MTTIHAQTSLGEYAVGGAAGDILDDLRSDDVALWFPHPRQRVFVWYAPSAADDSDAPDLAPWRKYQVDHGHRQDLVTADVVDRIEFDDAEYEYEMVSPTWCATCHNPIPEGEVVESATDEVRDPFCSASCLHECESHLGFPLSPSKAATDYSHPALRAQWEEQDADFADAHLPRWSE